MEDYKYMVRVSCMTYNHASYIEDAMNGFCMQETSFPFVCTIMDDASTDGEPEVIKRYLSAHFDMEDQSVVRHEETDDYCLTFAQHKTNRNCFFAVFFLKYNHYSIKKSKGPYMEEWRNAKYIALCEGDDYWTHPGKLEKQVGFMESHTDYSMCFHMVDIKKEEGIKPVNYFIQLENREYTANEIIKKWIIPTNSMLYRSEISNRMPKNNKFVYSDDVIYATCLLYGKIFGLSDVMGVYRLVPTGWMMTHLGKKRLYSSISQRKGLMEEFPFYRCDTNYIYMENVYFELMSILLKDMDFKEYKKVRNDYKETLPNRSSCRFVVFCIKSLLPNRVKHVKQLLKKND